MKNHNFKLNPGIGGCEKRVPLTLIEFSSVSVQWPGTKDKPPYYRTSRMPHKRGTFDKRTNVRVKAFVWRSRVADAFANSVHRAYNDDVQ